MHRDGVLELTLAEALAALDRAVTAVSNSRAYLTQQSQLWVTDAEYALEVFAHGEVMYALSDGGHSQLTYNASNRWCALTPGSSKEARERFEDALTERRALETIIAVWLDGQRPTDGEASSD